MCKVHNQIGSLSEIKAHFHRHNIKDLQSTNEVISFQKNYPLNRQQIISNTSLQIEKEKEILKEELTLLADFIETSRSEHTKDLHSELEQLKQHLDTIPSTQSNFFDKIINYFNRSSIQSKIRNIENHFDSKISRLLRHHTDLYERKRRRFEYIDNNFEKAVSESTFAQLRELDKKKTVVDEIIPTVYGAIGEQKVSDELQHLSDDYVLINNFSCSFNPPIYNRQENDYIKSVQIDHLLIAPSGVFLIETKNWSEQSMNNLSLRSPVEQIKRTSFALYRTLNGERSNYLLKHHWGERKIAIKNLIVMINQKPKEEFQYVKVLTLTELCHYVEYFKPVFSVNETQMIANYLLTLCDRKN